MITALLISSANKLLANEQNLQSSFSHIKLSVQMCEAVKNDQLAKLRKLLKDARVRMREIYSQLHCDGRSLITEASINRSTSVEKYLLLKVSASDINQAKEVEVIKTASFRS